jgi:hypothetical protein
LQTIATISAPTRINKILVSTTDTAKDVQLVATIGGTDYILVTASIATNSGSSSAAPTVSLLDNSMWSLNNDISNNKVLELIGSVGTPITLKAKAGTNIASTKVINILMTGQQDIA